MIEKYLCIEPSGKVRWIDLERRARHDQIYCGAESILLSDLYPVIGCSCVEQVYSRFHGIVFCVDECGKIKDPMQPFNALASRFYAGSEFGDFIYGPAVFFSMRRSEPYGEYDLFPLSPAQESQISLVLGFPLPDKENAGNED